MLCLYSFCIIFDQIGDKIRQKSYLRREIEKEVIESTCLRKTEKAKESEGGERMESLLIRGIV